MLSKTYDEILTSLQTAYRNALAEADLREGSDIWVRIAVEAALLESLYLYADWVAKQIFPDTADPDSLEHHAGLFGLTREVATTAWGHVAITGVPGTVVNLGVSFIGPDGVEGETTEGGTTDGLGNLVVSGQTSTLGAGANLAQGAVLALTNPPANVASAATAADEWAGGQDAESDSVLLARLLDRLRRPPAGGNQHDYEVWAMAVTGVENAWCYPLRRGLGTADVVITAPGADRIPGALLLASVQAAIDAVRPVTAKETLVLAPDPVAVNIAVSVLAETGFGGDWTGTKTVQAGSTAGTIVVASTTGLAAQMRVVIEEQERIIDTVVDATSFTLTQPLSAAPTVGATIYPGGPLWQLLYDALHGYLAALDPPVFLPGGSYPVTRTIYKSYLEGLVSQIEHVADRTLSSPSSNVTATVDGTHAQMHAAGTIVITFA